ncbi:MAG: hypothetical protein U0X76_00250 [Bacteroidia bacterium]
MLITAMIIALVLGLMPGLVVELPIDKTTRKNGGNLKPNLISE